MTQRVWWNSDSRPATFRPFLVVLLIGLMGLASSWGAAAQAADDGTKNERNGHHSRGSLVISGGGDIPSEIRDRFHELAGGVKARIVVIPTANRENDRTTLKRCLSPWTRFSTNSLTMLHTLNRAVADTREFTESLREATGVWICGGNQERLSDVYAGTETERQLEAVLDRGGVIGGTSAGAAIMTKIMIADGRDKAVLGKGFNLLEGAVVDQHFMTRNRIGRLLGVLEDHPGLVGFGIDEDTAMIVDLHDQRLRIFGDSYVVACVPDRSSHHARIEFLKENDEIDLATLKSPGKPAIAAAGEGSR